MSYSMSPFPLRFGSRQGGGGDPPPIYHDDFSTGDDVPNWARGFHSVDGTLAVVGGQLTHTKGAGDGTSPRFVRAITGLTIGLSYPLKIGLGGTAGLAQRGAVATSSAAGTGGTTYFGGTAPFPDLTMVPTATTMYIAIFMSSGTSAGQTVTFDYMTILNP